ncbi:MAG TPA: hypothetical protein VF390_02890 [Patescibacteria group bacterium]
MKPEEYFPRPIKEKPGEEPFLPPFTNAIKSERPEKKMIKRICAWCNKELGEKEAEGEGATHGICPECAEKNFGKEMPIKKGE